MSDATSTNGAATPTKEKQQHLTPREQELIGKLLGCTKSPIEIDYDKLAEAMGMSNPRSAANSWAAIRKKLGNPALLGSPAAKTPGGRAQRKRAVKAADPDDDENDSDYGTPTKKRKASTRKPKAKSEPKVDIADDEDGEDVEADENSIPVKAEVDDDDDMAV